jgi:DNA primase
MRETEKLDILESILGGFYRSKDEYLFFCKKCEHHKKKLSVNFEKDCFKCWVCDYSGKSLRRLVNRFGTYQQQCRWNELSGIVEINDFAKIFDEKLDVKEETLTPLPDEFVSLCNKDVSLSSLPARRYLKDRGLTKEDILFWKIGYCSTGEYAGRVVVPSFNLNGNVNYYIGRTYEDNWKKYMNPSVSKDLIFNELYIDWNSDIVIVEGIFDAIKATNAIPILGSTLRENSRLFREIIKNDPAVYIALDPDAEKKAERLITSLLNYDVEVYKVPIPQNMDVGDMTKEQFIDLKHQSSRIKNQDYFLMKKIMGI